MTMSEEDQIFFGGTTLGEIAQLKALKKAQKIVFEFVVDIERKDRFLQLIHSLSVPEFGVDVDLKSIWVKAHLEDRDRLIKFRVKASGPELNLKRWKDNIQQVLDFLNGENCLTYTKTICKA